MSSSGSESDTEAGKDRASRSIRDDQKEAEKPWCVVLSDTGIQGSFTLDGSFLSVLNNQLDIWMFV